MFILLKTHFLLKINDNSLVEWGDMFKDQLVTLLSSGEYSEDIVDIDDGQLYIMYFISLYFNFVIMMNLLIAIIGEKFGVVLE